MTPRAEQICTAYRDGATLRMLAARFGVTKQAISLTLKRYGYSPTPAEFIARCSKRGRVAG